MSPPWNSLLEPEYSCRRSTSGAKYAVRIGQSRTKAPISTELAPQNPDLGRCTSYVSSLYIRRRRNRFCSRQPSESARFCYTWVIPLHFSLTTKPGVPYDFPNPAFFPTGRMRTPLLPLVPLWLYPNAYYAQERAHIGVFRGRDGP